MNHVDETKLKQALSKYQNVEMTRKDVSSAIRLYPSLRYRNEPFIFNDGRRKELLNLQGTIPISYKGNQYHIPVCIWLMDTHPNNAPICYVTPTPEMSIKVSMYIDHNGKVYLPYLHDWVPHTSDLMSLIQVMIIIFGEEPPVFTKRRTETQTSTPYPVQPFMPVPGGGSNINAEAYPTPYPPTSQYPGATTPYPPHMPMTGMPYPGHGQPYPASGTTNYQGPGYPGGSYPPYPVAQPSSTLPGRCENNSGTITEEHIRASLLSAVGDKLRRRLREQFSQLQAELETLRRTQQELTNGSSRLTELISKLNQDKQELEKNIINLQDKESELEKDIGKLSDNQSIDVDEAVTTIAPLYKQMLNAFAEEAAIEDAIYYLAEGVRGGTIDLDAFLKQVRQLSRRQFMLRALMLLCRQKAGLAN